MLLGGITACICCILRHVNLLYTLLTVLISLIVFMIIGLIVNKIYMNIKGEVEAKEKEEARKAEQERLEAERAAEEEKQRLAAEQEGITEGEESDDDDWSQADQETGGEEF